MIPIAKPVIEQDEVDAVVAALKSGQLTGGPMVAEFETELAKYSGYKHAIAVANGTAALHIAMHALDLGKGDQVLVPDFTFIATANAPRFVGAKPVFCDVDVQTFNLDPSKLEKKINPKTKAILPVSLYGQAYDVDAVRALAQEKNIPVVSDNCQAVGAEWSNVRNFGDSMATLSFYPTKNMTSTEGGAILTDRDDLAEECRLWRNIGQRKPYDYAHMGYNYRLNSVSCALGLAQLKKLDRFTAARRKHAAMLNDLLAKKKGMVLPFVHPKAGHVYNQFTIKTKHRDALKEHLAKQNVGSNIYYPMPLSSLPTFGGKGGLPVTRKLCQQVLSIPVHPALTETDVHAVADAVLSFKP